MHHMDEHKIYFQRSCCLPFVVFVDLVSIAKEISGMVRHQRVRTVLSYLGGANPSALSLP